MDGQQTVGEDVDVLNQVREMIEREGGLSAWAKIVVGVSGGPDSLCLLHVMERLGADYGWSLHVAHMNHCLRGGEADDDMVSVALAAMQRGLPCTIEVVDVGGVAQRRRLSVEEAARQVRYGFLLDTARRIGAAVVAVGHNADDQSETVLMHFLRGTGLAGLRGMLSNTDLASLHTVSERGLTTALGPPIRLVRPLLHVTRAEIEQYCQAHGLAPRVDRSNLDTALLRNRLRHELLPLLETYNPNIRELLRRTAAVAAADYDLIAAVRQTAWSQVVQTQDTQAVVFRRSDWCKLPLALQRSTLREATYQLRPHLRDVDFVHLEQAVDVAVRGPTGAQATLPGGLCLTVGYQTLRLAGKEVHAPRPDWPLLWSDEPLPVTLPGQTRLPDSGWRLEIRWWNGPKEVALHNADCWSAYFDADRLGTSLALRSRQPGDRFQPLGINGQTKVADWMINAKIPRRWRAHIPLLIHHPPVDTGREQIAWIVGWRIDARVRVTSDTQRIVHCVFREADETSR
jgi:tRNA(Ile)-lysidine synthase